MYLKSGKLNIIDQKSYQNIKSRDVESIPKVSRSSKYKSHHEKGEKCNLLDYLTKPRSKQKQLNKRKGPNLKVARNLYIAQVKRKGKSRLHPKHKISRLKRIIKHNRSVKQLARKDEAHSSSIIEEKPTSCLNTIRENETTEPQNPLQIAEINEVITDVSKLSLATGDAKNPLPQTHGIHSRRFRSYCDNCTTQRLKELTNNLLIDLDRFQKRAHANNEIKARAHPRFVVGFREASSRLRIRKVKLLIIAPDCEACGVEGGLDDVIAELKWNCQQHQVPYCFSLKRRELAYALHKRAQISCVSILDYDGANDTYKQLLEELKESRQLYEKLTSVTT